MKKTIRGQLLLFFHSNSKLDCNNKNAFVKKDVHLHFILNRLHHV